jgi:hypothetical protein
MFETTKQIRSIEPSNCGGSVLSQDHQIHTSKQSQSLSGFVGLGNAWIRWQQKNGYLNQQK